MDQEQLEYFRQVLIGERKRILENTQHTRREGLELSSDDMADENDLASALYDQGFNLRLRDRERSLLVKINKALRLINEGDYGYCEVCDDDIDLRRLKARPVTTMCVECKEDAERKERSYAPRDNQDRARAARFGGLSFSRGADGKAAKDQGDLIFDVDLGDTDMDDMDEMSMD